MKVFVFTCMILGFCLVGYGAGFTWGPVEHYGAYFAGMGLVALGVGILNDRC